jgi:hypothetical protein
MVHNLVDGLPTDAILKLDELRTANAERKFGFVGLEGFEERIFSLQLDKIEGLLGMAATAQDAQNLQAAELRDLVSAIMAAADAHPADVPLPA